MNIIYKCVCMCVHMYLTVELHYDKYVLGVILVKTNKCERLGHIKVHLHVKHY